ncbi:MAG: S-layer homology domain-containing protein [Kocuria sp.]|nr:S-layer homology domain-containing protein [Kocuria sp.]
MKNIDRFSIPEHHNSAENPQFAVVDRIQGFSRRRVLAGTGGALAAAVLLGGTGASLAHAAPARTADRWDQFLVAGEHHLNGGVLTMGKPQWASVSNRFDMLLSLRSTSSGPVQLTWSSTDGSKESRTLQPGETWEYRAHFDGATGYDAVHTLESTEGGDQQQICAVVLAPWMAARAVLPSGGNATITDAAACGDDLYRVRWALKTNITLGDPQSLDVTTFHPFRPLRRDEAVDYLYNLRGTPYVSTQVGSRYRDVDTRNRYKRAIIWATTAGIATGWGGGANGAEFRPQAAVTREAMAAFLYRYATNFLPASLTSIKKSTYSDVPAGSQFADAIGWVGAMGEITGSTFRPQDPVTRLEAVRFVHQLHMTVIAM